MTDTQPDPTPPFSAAVTKTYSLTMSHISKVAEISQRYGISQGEVVRNAIDLYWNALQPTIQETAKT